MIKDFVTLVLASVLGWIGMPVGSTLAEDIPAELLQDVKGGVVARSQVMITGSETMGAFTARIFESLAASWQIPPPDVRPAGTHAGFLKFCEGIGAEFPDIVAATRRMRQSELDICIDKKIVDIIEIPIGFSAVAFVQRRDDQTLNLTPKILYQAIAADVPVGQDMLANPFQTWRQIDKKLPATDINVILPNAAAGTRNFFDDMFMQGGCRKYSVIKNIFDDTERVRMCTTVRKDGRVIELSVTYDDQLPKKLMESPAGTLGMLPYFVALKHLDTLKILPINDIMPSAKTIVDDSYEGVHTLYYYVKRAHMRDHQGHGVVRGLRQFILEVTSEAARGPGGYLEAMGVVPLAADDRASERRSALRLERFTR